MTDHLNKIKELTGRIEELEREQVVAAKAALRDGTAYLFDKYPFVAKVSWTQYTPFFNDGDPCEFSSGAGEAYLFTQKDVDNEDDGHDYESGEDFYDKSSEFHYDYSTRPLVERRNAGYDPAYEAAAKDWRELLGAIGDDQYKRLFGDHVEVFVTREGIEVEDYEHE